MITLLPSYPYNEGQVFFQLEIDEDHNSGCIGQNRIMKKRFEFTKVPIPNVTINNVALPVNRDQYYQTSFETYIDYDINNPEFHVEIEGIYPENEYKTYVRYHYFGSESSTYSIYEGETNFTLPIPQILNTLP